MERKDIVELIKKLQIRVEAEQMSYHHCDYSQEYLRKRGLEGFTKVTVTLYFEGQKVSSDSFKL